LPDTWLIPATVEVFPLDGGRARLSVLFTSGSRGKLDGRAEDIREIQTVMLGAMSAQTVVNVGQWPAMKIGSGYEHDW